jgi:hypothetical protein
MFKCLVQRKVMFFSQDEKKLPSQAGIRENANRMKKMTM